MEKYELRTGVLYAFQPGDDPGLLIPVKVLDAYHTYSLRDFQVGHYPNAWGYQEFRPHDSQLDKPAWVRDEHWTIEKSPYGEWLTHGLLVAGPTFSQGSQPYYWFDGSMTELEKAARVDKVDLAMAMAETYSDHNPNGWVIDGDGKFVPVRPIRPEQLVGEWEELVGEPLRQELAAWEMERKVQDREAERYWQRRRKAKVELERLEKSMIGLKWCMALCAVFIVMAFGSGSADNLHRAFWGLVGSGSVTALTAARIRTLERQEW